MRENGSNARESEWEGSMAREREWNDDKGENMKQWQGRENGSMATDPWQGGERRSMARERESVGKGERVGQQGRESRSAREGESVGKGESGWTLTEGRRGFDALAALVPAKGHNSLRVAD